MSVKSLKKQKKRTSQCIVRIGERANESVHCDVFYIFDIHFDFLRDTEKNNDDVVRK